MKLAFYTTVLSVVLNYSTQAQSSVTLTPSQDAGVGFHDGYESADVNYEYDETYKAFYQPGASGGENGARGLMQFDLSDIPEGAIVTSAILDLYGHGPFGVGVVAAIGDYGDNGSVLLRITEEWDEDVVTWNTQPETTTENAVELPVSTSVDEDYLNIDVTSLVQDMIDDPDNSYGFEIKLITESPSRGLAFCSSDYFDSSKYPTLKISYTGDAISNEVNENLISVYPNPASFQYVLTIDQFNFDGKYEFSIFNAMGMVVKTLGISDKITNVDISDLVVGTYIISIFKNGDNIANKNIVVE